MTSMGMAGAYPINIEVDGPSSQSRLTVFFRYFMIIPHVIVLYALQLVVSVVSFLAWFAIMFTGNSHTLEFNHMRHLALETEDVGATYCGGRDWISPRGTVIRYNFIHDVLGYGWNGKWTSPYFAWGIYLDDNSGGVDVIGNIVARCGRSLIHGHSARDCRVENNIFIEGGLRQWEFNGWTTKHRFWTDHLPAMEKGFASVANQPAWKTMRGMDVPPAQIPLLLESPQVIATHQGQQLLQYIQECQS